MNPLTTFGLGGDIWMVLKIMFLIGMGLYLVFGLIVIRQVTHMTNTLRVGFEGPIKLFAWGHFLASIGLLVLAFLFL